MSVNSSRARDTIKKDSTGNAFDIICNTLVFMDSNPFPSFPQNYAVLLENIVQNTGSHSRASPIAAATVTVIITECLFEYFRYDQSLAASSSSYTTTSSALCLDHILHFELTAAPAFFRRLCFLSQPTVEARISHTYTHIQIYDPTIYHTSRMADSDDSQSHSSATSSLVANEETSVNDEASLTEGYSETARGAVKTDISRKHSVKRSIPKKSDGVKAPSETRKALTDIETPNDTDVLSGRGNFVNYHPGNLLFRELVQKHKMAYVACPKPQKSGYAELIVSELREQGARFLTRNEKTKLWHDIGDKKALMKTRQALREGAPDIAEKIGGKGSTSAARGSARAVAAASKESQNDGAAGKKRKDSLDSGGGTGALKKSKKGARRQEDRDEDQSKAAAVNRLVAPNINSAGVLPPSFAGHPLSSRGRVASASDPNSLRILSEAAESVDQAKEATSGAAATTVHPNAAISGAATPVSALGDAALAQGLPPGYAATLYSLQAQQANPAFALSNPYAVAAIPGFGIANPYLANPFAAAAMYPSPIEADPRLMAAHARLAAAEARLAALAGGDPRLLMGSAAATAAPASYLGLLPPTASAPPPAQPPSSKASPGSPSDVESPQVQQ